MDSEKSEFIRLTAAPREAVEKLETYAAMLKEWNEKFNLVAPSTIDHVWSRHFLDSAQLMPLLADTIENSLLADLGAGAGFPSMVLGIMGKTNVHPIEATGKKADFLRNVVDRLGLRTTIIHQCRVEELKDFRVDIITARALAPLKDLLSLAARISRKETICLFLKGQKADVELTEARKCWMFDCAKVPSLSDPSGTVLAIRNFRYDTKPRSKHSRHQ